MERVQATAVLVDPCRYYATIQKGSQQVNNSCEEGYLPGFEVLIYSQSLCVHPNEMPFHASRVTLEPLMQWH